MTLSKVLGLSLILAMSALFIQVYFTSESQKELAVYKTRCDSLQVAVDSLFNENYPCQIELGRYQVAYEIFMDRNPNAAKQYGTIISEETE